jgi:hypothetical protein
LVIAADFDVSGVEPDIRPVAFDRPCEQGVRPLVDLTAQFRRRSFRSKWLTGFLWQISAARLGSRVCSHVQAGRSCLWRLGCFDPASLSCARGRNIHLPIQLR